MTTKVLILNIFFKLEENDVILGFQKNASYAEYCIVCLSIVGNSPALVILGHTDLTLYITH